MADYTCRSQQRLIKAIAAMAGRELDGIAPGELAELTGMNASQVTAALANLQIAGWAEKNPSGTWRLTPKPVMIFGKVAESFERARLKVMEQEAYYLNGGKR